MDTFQIVSFLCILIASIAGGFVPLTKRVQARSAESFPRGQAFTAGVFLALSLFIMLPAGLHLFQKVFPHIHYPLAVAVSLTAFLLLLAVEHWTHHMDSSELSSPIIPIIMTVMIAIPSFLLGTALGVSQTSAAIFIFIAVLAHKSSAGFGLALMMVKSRLTTMQTYLLYACFALATPIGIIVGADLHQWLKGEGLVLTKAIILSLASGVFLFMSTMHGLAHTPLIKHCTHRKGFLLMLIGLVLTALVRLVLGLAHAG